MPIYAYKCESCGFAKDVLQKMSDPQLTDCPTCGAASFKKQLTSAGFQLKGSGWYATDFKGGATPPATPATPGSADAAASVKTATTESAKSGEVIAKKSDAPSPAASGSSAPA
ncbi:MAG: putative FmdB family regulatory protein [Rhodoferax sp.]|jgi:putative FmdB family regulatory protein